MSFVTVSSPGTLYPSPPSQCSSASVSRASGERESRFLDVVGCDTGVCSNAWIIRVCHPFFFTPNCVTTVSHPSNHITGIGCVYWTKTNKLGFFKLQKTFYQIRFWSHSPPGSTGNVLSYWSTFLHKLLMHRIIRSKVRFFCVFTDCMCQIMTVYAIFFSVCINDNLILSKLIRLVLVV